MADPLAITPATAAAPERRERLAWPDAFRGCTMFFIAVGHATLLLGQHGLPMAQASDFVLRFQTLGMGLFYAISGMNSRRYVDSSWRGFLGLRVWPMAYLLVLWSTVFYVVDQVASGSRLDPVGVVRGVVWNILLPLSHMWYLWSLIVYLLLCRLLVPRFPRATLVVALCLSTVSTTLDDGFFQRQGIELSGEVWVMRRVLGYAFFFFMGYRFPDRLAGLATGPALVKAVSWTLVAEGLTWLAFVPHRTAILVPLLFAALLAKLVGAVHIGRLLARIPLLGGVLRRIGRLTLPIYLIHMPVAVVLTALAFRDAATPLRLHPGLAVAVIALLSIAGSLAFAFAAQRLGLVWLLRPPGYRNPRAVVTP